MTSQKDSLDQVIEKGFSLMRVSAMVRRYVYLLQSGWVRIIELAYWPIMQMILWGFMTEFLLNSSSQVLRAGGVLIAAVLLWDVLFRSNIGVAVSFLEEIWSRNLAQLCASPLKSYEWGISLVLISLLRTLIGVVPAALLAVPLYHFSIFEMGLPLVAFFFNLMIFGAAVGLAVSSLVLRYGLGAESLAWVGIFLIAPISGIYYPISTLPDWLQTISYALPSSHVFEGMREVLGEQKFAIDRFLKGLGLNLFYLSAGMGIFLATFRIARRDGLLMQIGE
ncbi:MAG: ABC transporter permease [Rhodospirillaceae bacterium]